MIYDPFQLIINYSDISIKQLVKLQQIVILGQKRKKKKKVDKILLITPALKLRLNCFSFASPQFVFMMIYATPTTLLICILETLQILHHTFHTWKGYFSFHHFEFKGFDLNHKIIHTFIVFSKTINFNHSYFNKCFQTTKFCCFFTTFNYFWFIHFYAFITNNSSRSKVSKALPVY